MLDLAVELRLESHDLVRQFLHARRHSGILSHGTACARFNSGASAPIANGKRISQGDARTIRAMPSPGFMA
jgi:hypothetical protein